ncbi:MULTISPECIES: hypothetical protein [Sorangium]|uniref:hypothetical protein n=1 Tax=Sorangium TaxID=39643 RepID=UPI003D9C3E3B
MHDWSGASRGESTPGISADALFAGASPVAGLFAAASSTCAALPAPITPRADNSATIDRNQRVFMVSLPPGAFKLLLVGVRGAIVGKTYHFSDERAADARVEDGLGPRWWQVAAPARSDCPQVGSRGQAAEESPRILRKIHRESGRWGGKLRNTPRLPASLFNFSAEKGCYMRGFRRQTGVCREDAKGRSSTASRVSANLAERNSRA